LVVELAEIRNQVSDNRHVRERVDAHGVCSIGRNFAKTSQSVGTVDVHGTRTANT
jgi:hypothetical protein